MVVIQVEFIFQSGLITLQTFGKPISKGLMLQSRIGRPLLIQSSLHFNRDHLRYNKQQDTDLSYCVCVCKGMPLDPFFRSRRNLPWLAFHSVEHCTVRVAHIQPITDCLQFRFLRFTLKIIVARLKTVDHRRW